MTSGFEGLDDEEEDDGVVGTLEGEHPTVEARPEGFRHGAARPSKDCPRATVRPFTCNDVIKGLIKVFLVIFYYLV